MSVSTTADAATERVYLDGDDEIRGQKFVCLSFLTPEKALMRNKEAFMVSKFLDFFALDYKVKASESFLFAELRMVQDVLSRVEVDLANAFVDVSGVCRRSSSPMLPRWRPVSRSPVRSWRSVYPPIWRRT